MIKILATEHKDLKFVAFDGYEEWYLSIDGFVGLRPYTEADLRGQARDMDLEDYLDGEIPHFLEPYVDRTKFADDMEEQWDEMADIYTTREEEGKDDIYLCWGASTNIEYEFEKNNIVTYEDFVNYYEFVGLTEEEFNNLIK